MTSSRATAVPRSAQDVPAFAANFMAVTGLPPFAGGETMVGAPPAATTPPPAEPAAPAVPAPAAPAEPAAATPPAPTPTPGAPADPAAAPVAPAEQPPDWASTLLERTEQLLGAPAPDPYAVDLGLVEPPPALPGQPASQPGALPPGTQPPASPSAAPNTPPRQRQLQPGDDIKVVQDWVREEAREMAEQMFKERVEPRFAQEEQTRRRNEIEGLAEAFPEIRDPKNAQALFRTARNWAAQAGNEALAREPVFLEIALLANKFLATQQPAPPAPAPTAPGGEVPIEPAGPAAPGAAATPSQQRADAIAAASGGTGLSTLWGGRG